MSSSRVPVIASSQKGTVLHAFGETVIIHLNGEETGGIATVWTEITPAGGGPPPHYHEREDEWFYIEEGRVAFFFDNEWHELGPGGTVFMPRNAVHAFKNIGTTPSRMRLTTSPSGFETFFARCAEEFSKPGAPDMPRIMQISREHGIHFVAS
jgi:quercetin dioxygenase-like cupin family protein